MRPILLHARSNTVRFAPADLGQELCCPRCDGSYLHHGRVQVFDRGEDAALVSVTTVCHGLSATHLMPSAAAGNPSSRRGGIRISFDCEACGGDIELTISQHKGNTNFGWEYGPREDRET